MQDINWKSSVPQFLEMHLRLITHPRMLQLIWKLRMKNLHVQEYRLSLKYNLDPRECNPFE